MILWFCLTFHTALSFGQVRPLCIWKNCTSFKKKCFVLFFWQIVAATQNLFLNSFTVSLSLIYIYISQVASYMYLNLNSMAPPSLSLTFETNSSIHSHFTRTANNLHVPLARANLWKAALMICGPKIWNSTPLMVRKSNSEFIFKRRIKAWLLSRYN